VTTQATFWEHAHRVQWSSDATSFSWSQDFTSSVEEVQDRSLLTPSSKSPARASFDDRRRRAAIFRTLVDAVSETLSEADAVTDDPPTDDRLRYWNGVEWTVEPPPSSG
jgi:predicted aminopeptidase